MTDYSKITALYSRLSVGDEDRDGGESNSIKNQLHTGGNHLFQHTTSFTLIRRGGMSAKTNRVQRKITIPP